MEGWRWRKVCRCGCGRGSRSGSRITHCSCYRLFLLLMAVVSVPSSLDLRVVADHDFGVSYVCGNTNIVFVSHENM
jgi:hypothetical protein